MFIKEYYLFLSIILMTILSHSFKNRFESSDRGNHSLLAIRTVIVTQDTVPCGQTEQTENWFVRNSENGQQCN